MADYDAAELQRLLKNKGNVMWSYDNDTKHHDMFSWLIFLVDEGGARGRSTRTLCIRPFYIKLCLKSSKKQKRTRVPSIDVSDQVESAVLRTYGMVWRWCGGRYGVAEIAMMTMNGCFSGLENRSRSSSRTPIHNQCAHWTFIASVARWNYPTQFSLLSFFLQIVYYCNQLWGFV